MKTTYHYASVSKALEELQEMDFTIDFNLREEIIKQNPENYVIAHVYRYEGNSNPDDQAVVYGIKCSSGEKGVFVAGFSAKSDNETALVLEKISFKER